MFSKASATSLISSMMSFRRLIVLTQKMASIGSNQDYRLPTRKGSLNHFHVNVISNWYRITPSSAFISKTKFELILTIVKRRAVSVVNSQWINTKLFWWTANSKVFLAANEVAMLWKLLFRDLEKWSKICVAFCADISLFSGINYGREEYLNCIATPGWSWKVEAIHPRVNYVLYKLHVHCLKRF